MCGGVLRENFPLCPQEYFFLTEALTFPEGTHYHLEKGSCVFKKQEADNLEGEAGSEKTGNKITQEGFKAWSF